MKHYKTINTLLGFIIFIIASTVYGLTIEPTASFWDCGEFILSSYKLEVGHPPGAPFFMLTANFFTQFVSDPGKVAMMVNLMSALMSGACIMFLFWTITYLTKKLLVSSNTLEKSHQTLAIFASGAVGSFVYMFSDTFWFSAVEGEVYAYSSLFTAIVFWLILKWDAEEESPQTDRWLILIAYLTGLSIGVHLLNLLCIPAIVMVYFYKKKPEAKLKEASLALLFSAVLVAVVLYGMVPGVIKVGGAFDLFFVNSLGFSFNTGLVVYLLTLILVLGWSIYKSIHTQSQKNLTLTFLASIAIVGIPFYGEGISSLLIGAFVLAAMGFLVYTYKKVFTARVINTTILCITMIMVGYSSYTLIIMRSLANTPMDQNSPEDIFTLGSYLGREQYGTRPLFYGQTFKSQLEFNDKGEPLSKGASYTYIPQAKETPDEPDRYQKVAKMPEYIFKENMLFPRLYSHSHAPFYNQWIDMEGKQLPTQLDNIQFFLKYQVGYMYWRYFLWNFVGRQNDIHIYGREGELDKGNWITGIPILDNLAYGDQDRLPKVIKENKARNSYYALPLLLGIIGILWQLSKGRRGKEHFSVVFLLFFMTGLAIIFYLNQTPAQVRERDYAYAGSFYAFAIWVGMGVIGLIRLIKDVSNKENLTITAIVSGLCLLVPIQMGCQNWDDHDRSNRYFARDFGQNYLNSTQENCDAILFNNGDNDTFPLWYNQEVEGARLDVRTCNFSYIQTDWYIDQMIRPAYSAPGLPIQWDRKYYAHDTNSVVPIEPRLKKHIEEEFKAAKIEAKEKGDTRKLKLAELKYGKDPFTVQNVFDKWVKIDQEEYRVIPTDTLRIKVDKDAVLRSGMMIPKGYTKEDIPEYVTIPLTGKRHLTKGNLMFLEVLANANWERPVYVAVSVGGDEYLNLDKYLVQEGMAYRFTPFDWEAIEKQKLAKQLTDIDINEIPHQIPVDSKRMYDNLMHKFKFGGMDREGIFIDYKSMDMCLVHRRLFIQLANQLIEENQKEKALEVLDYCSKHIPSSNVPHDLQSYSHAMAERYYLLGEKEKADAIILELADHFVSYIDWTLALSDRNLSNAIYGLQDHFSNLRYVISIMSRNQSVHTDEYAKKAKAYEAMLTHRIKGLQ